MTSVPSAGSTGPAPKKYEVADAKMVKVYKSMSGIYRRSMTPSVHHNFSGPAIGLISDHNSQFSQLSQVLTGYASPSTSPPPGLLSYNSLSKSAIQLVEWGNESLRFVKSKFGYHLTWEDRLSYFQKSSYLAYNLCSGMNLVKNVVGFFNNQQFSSAVSKAFGHVAIAAGSTLAIFSGLRAIKAIGEFYKVYQYKSLLGRCVLMSEKMEALRSMIYVSEKELFANPLDVASKKAFFKQYYDKKIVEAETEAMTLLGKKERPDIKGLIAGLGSVEAKEVYKTQLGLSEQMMEGLSAEELCGLILMKEEKTIKKREKLASLIGSNTTQGKHLIEAIQTMSKVQAIANPDYKASEANEEIEALFSKVQQMTNRKLLKEGAIIASCILTIAASITTLVCPAAFPLIIVMWVISNAIEFGVSLKDFSDAAKDKELEPTRVYPEALDWKQWFANTGAWTKDNWREIISVGVNIIAIGLVVASLCINPITAPLVGVAIASILALALYSYFNACLVHKGARDRLVIIADGIDRVVNKNIAGFLGIDIDPQEKIKSLSINKDWLSHKLMSLDIEDKYAFFVKLKSKGKIGDFEDFRNKSPKERRAILSSLHLKLETIIKQEPSFIADLYKEFKLELRKHYLQNIETYKKPK